MTIYESNCYSGQSSFNTKEEMYEVVEARGFLAKHPFVSLVIVAAFGFFVVKLTLLLLP